MIDIMIRYYFFIYFLLQSISIYADKRASIEITPTMNKGGEIIIKIDSLERRDFKRLILFPLPIEVSPFHVKDSVSKFNGFWYIDSNNSKTIPWIGSILEPNKTSLEIKMNVPNMMQDSELKPLSWKLTILQKNQEGLHSFMLGQLTDSVEFVFIDSVKFKRSVNCEITEEGPKDFWDTINETIIGGAISSLQQDTEIFLLFEYSNTSNNLKFILGMFISFFISLITGTQCYNYPKRAKKRIAIICGIFITSILIMSSFYLFKDMKIDMKEIYYSLVPFFGFWIGLLSNLKKKNKTK